jgi:predicted phosphate transport protein (TIGR00153 family)
MFGSPKASDQVFFKAFATHSEKSVAAAKQLVDLLREPQRAAELAKSIKQLEHEGDDVTHETVKALHETWITPLDRYDIHAIMTSLDDILDGLEAVAERMVLFEIDESNPLATELAGVLVRMCEKIAQAMALLPSLSKRSTEALELCRELNKLESEADRVYRASLGELFKGRRISTPPPGENSRPQQADWMYAMKWREIFEYLESTADTAEEIANVLEGIVLEYA